jgi:hypothetical protein
VLEGRGHITAARDPEWTREIQDFLADTDRPA